MQETGYLILANSLRRVAQGRGHGCAHPGSPDRVRSVVAANQPPRPKRVRDIIETHEPRDESPWDYKRGGGSRNWSHSVVYDGENIFRRKTVSRRDRQECSINVAIFAKLGCTYPMDLKLPGVMPTTSLITGRVALALLLLTQATSSAVCAAGLDQLSDLTGKAIVSVTLTGRDNFNSEYRYDLIVRNRSNDPLIADSLIVVLEKITNLAGEDREPLKNEPLLQRFEVVGQDGETDEGKPFFRVPAGAGPDLAPLNDSPPFSVRIRNKDYVAVFTPTFRVYGKKRQPAEPKISNSQPQPGSAAQDRTDRLIQLLLKKGIITEEERKAIQP
jgi:hypothetical protein